MDARLAVILGYAPALMAWLIALLGFMVAVIAWGRGNYPRRDFVAQRPAQPVVRHRRRTQVPAWLTVAASMIEECVA